MLRLPVLLLLIAVVAPAQEQHANPSPGAKFRISGTVVLGVTGHAAAKANLANRTSGQAGHAQEHDHR